MNAITPLGKFVLLLIAFAVYVFAHSANAQDEGAAKKPAIIRDLRDLSIEYPDGCDKGFEKILIELQLPSTYGSVTIECGKLVDD